MLSIFKCDGTAKLVGSKWIPAFAGMTGSKWIPAYAGMTTDRCISAFGGDDSATSPARSPESVGSCVSSRDRCRARSTPCDRTLCRLPSRDSLALRPAYRSESKHRQCCKASLNRQDRWPGSGGCILLSAPGHPSVPAWLHPDSSLLHRQG